MIPICFPKHKLCSAARTGLLAMVLTVSLILTSHLLQQAPSQHALQESQSAILSGNPQNVSHDRSGHVTFPRGRTERDMWQVPPPGAKRNQLAIIKCGARLLNMCHVLRTLGYRTQFQPSKNQTADVIWTASKLYAYKTNITQLVSYMHGCKPLHNKHLLLTGANISVILPAFILPAEQQQLTQHVPYLFLVHNYSGHYTHEEIGRIAPARYNPKFMQTKKPGVLWIRKNLNHRGVRIVSNKGWPDASRLLFICVHDTHMQHLRVITQCCIVYHAEPSEVNQLHKVGMMHEYSPDLLRGEAMKGSYLVQEFMAKPFLISNRKFDMGIFAMVTSISPLRMYLYTEDFQIKFCVADYLPFDPTVLEKYVEESVLKKVWEIPALKNLSGTPGSRRDKDVLYEYLENQGYSSQSLHERMIAAASEVGSKKERAMAEWDAKVPVNSNRFEFLRFDMALQEDLSLMVIEINLSPVTFTVRGSPHKDMFLKILTSTALMAGLVNASWTDEKVAYLTDVKSVTNKEISVDNERCKACLPDICKIKLECKVCSSCLTPRDELTFKKAVLEQRRKKDWTRVVPPPFKNQEAATKWNPLSDPLYLATTEATKIMALWYHRKCLTDAAWC